jgi:hypothetical protein
MQHPNNIPTKEDWYTGNSPGTYCDLDVKYAREKFMGKSIEEVRPYFKRAPLEAAECISYMPQIPFRYYILAYKTLFQSKAHVDELLDNREAADAASSFLGLLDMMMKEWPEVIIPVMVELMPVGEYVASNQELFEASIGIYGSFPERLEEIKSLYAKLFPLDRAVDTRVSNIALCMINRPLLHCTCATCADSVKRDS